MNIRTKDERLLEAMATARQHHPGLATLLDFYHDLYAVQLSAKAACREPVMPDEATARRRLADGRPQVAFDQLCIEPVSLARTAAEVEAVLARHNPGWDRQVSRWTGEALVAIARELFEHPVPAAGWGGTPDTTPEGESGPEPSIRLTVRFALGPHLRRAAETILPELDLSAWVHAFCPVCAGQPDLALLDAERGARRLVCSRCDAHWGYSRIGCPFCQTRETQTYCASDDGLYRLYVCPGCRRYLKTVDLREAQREVYPALERLLTVGMDLAAAQAGFRECALT